MTERANRQRGGGLASRMRTWGWNYGTDPNGIRHRLYSLAAGRWPWWDWGHRVVVLVGRDHGGNWGEVVPPTWWYRTGTPTRMWRTRYPRHPLSTFEIITDYSELRDRLEGLTDDEAYEWKAICVDQDHDLKLGRQFWGDRFYGLNHWEVALLRRYLRHWRRLDWWGLRSWIYSQALHAAVHVRKPFSCQEVPPRGSGGYSHWHCQLKRHHDGLHRFNNMTWGEVGGECIGVTHVPEVVS